MENIYKLKDHAPVIYWRAVDMAREEKSAAYILDQVRWMIECENEYRAIRGIKALAITV